MNRVEYIGRLTTDGTMNYSPNGTAFYKNTIAVDRKRKREGEPEADFFRFKLFGKAAETFEQWTKKGSKVFLAGWNMNENYTDKEGVKHYEIAMLVDDFEFLDNKTNKADTNQDDGFLNVPDSLSIELPFE